MDWVPFRAEDFTPALTRARQHAQNWLPSVEDRAVHPRSTVQQMLDVFGGPLPARGCSPEQVVDLLAEGAEPGLMAIQSGRFFGWVMVNQQ